MDSLRANAEQESISCVTTMNLYKLSQQEFKGALIGMIWGDGSINERGMFRTSSVVESWVLAKEKILSQLTETTMNKDEKRLGAHGTKPLYQLYTRVHPVYQKLRLHTYLEGRKQATGLASSLINPLGVLIWYLDDGCLDDADGGIRFQIHSNCFGEAEHQMLARAMNDRFGLRFNVRTAYKKAKGTTYYWLYLKAADRLVFWDAIIAPFYEWIPEEMKYKIPRREDVESKMKSPLHKRFYENIV